MQYALDGPAVWWYQLVAVIMVLMVVSQLGCERCRGSNGLPRHTTLRQLLCLASAQAVIISVKLSEMTSQGSWDPAFLLNRPGKHLEGAIPEAHEHHVSAFGWSCLAVGGETTAAQNSGGPLHLVQHRADSAMRRQLEPAYVNLSHRCRWRRT